MVVTQSVIPKSLADWQLQEYTWLLFRNFVDAVKLYEQAMQVKRNALPEGVPSSDAPWAFGGPWAWFF